MTKADAMTGTPAAELGPIPATGFQSGLWFLGQVHPTVPMYSVPLVLRLRGTIDLDGVRAVLRGLARSHELLRLRFVAGEDGLGLVPGAVPEPEFVDLRVDPDPERAWARLLRTDLAQPVDLTAGPAHRSLVAALGASDTAVLLILHHICVDARAVDILLEDFRLGYESWDLTGTLAEPRETRPFREVVRELSAAVDGPAGDAARAYWQRTLDGVENYAPPADRPRQAVRTFAAGRLDRALPPGLMNRIDAACRDLRATRFMVFAAVFAVSLARWSGDRLDPVVAVPQTLRRSSRLDDDVAPLINTMPLHLPVDFGGSFRDLVASTRSRTAEAMRHAGIAFEEVVALSGHHRDPLVPDLTSVAFQVSTTGPTTCRAGRVLVERIDLDSPAEDMDLVWDVESTAVGDWLSVRYARESYNDATIDRMAADFLELAEMLCGAPEAPLNQVEYRADDEIARLWAAGEAPSAPAETGDVAALFTDTVACWPDRTALVLGSERWTYGELAARSAHIRDALASARVRSGDLVAVALADRADAVAAMIAVIRAGAAYLPIDTEQPSAHLSAVLAATRPAVVLSDGTAPWPADAADVPTLMLDAIGPGAVRHLRSPTPEVGSDVASLPEAGCYVMCTSGTTGRPKAVMITHRGVSSLACRPLFAGLGPGDTILQLAPLSFDASTFEIWGALLNGAALVLPDGARPTAAEIGRLVRRHAVTVLHVTAGLLRVLAESDLAAFAGLRILLTGGDVIPAAHVRTLMRDYPGLRVAACYGPTENTTFSTVAVLTEPPPTAVPLGPALPGRSAHVLDDWMRPTLAGAVGEVHVGGEGLARGYFGDPRQTAARFVAHPRPRTPGERLYRTGDMARRRADGTLEFLGRRDAQVKIRGFRVEPAEVEAALIAHPGVLGCVVRACGEAGERTLAAYVVPTRRGTSATELLTHLGSLLPAALIPSEWILLDELPLTAQGKVDARALERLAEQHGSDVGGAPPRTETEEAVHEIWCECLHRRRISVTASFFQVGGHSLSALRIAGRLERRFARPVPLAEVLRRQTIADLAAWLDTEARLTPLTEDERPGPADRRSTLPAKDLALATPDEMAALLRLTCGTAPLTEGTQR